MRQRRLKDLDQRLAVYADRIVENPKEHRGSWREVFGGCEKLYLELGCGKGRFLATHAQEDPTAGFIGAEGQESVLLRAAQTLEAAEVENVRIIGEFIHDITEYFSEGELDGLYLNFSDPWPKARHAKRRLTHRRYLESYRKVVKPGGTVEFKSDNDDLFAFTMEELHDCNFEILEETTDLHSTEMDSVRFCTEYEEKFSSRGKNINYVKFRI